MSRIQLRAMTTAVAVMMAVSSASIRAQSASSQNAKHVADIERQIAGREKDAAESVFKNIQTFKGMPAIRVLRVMDMAFTANLGVDCTHCHTPSDWSSDEKAAKKVARGMWTLRAEVQAQVRKLTGKDNVPVTCYTCHKGQPIPSFQPQ